VEHSRKSAIPTSEVTLEPRESARQETKKAAESFAAGLNVPGATQDIASGYSL
jgi:hypothetical protein